jgi:hypothetical protein
MGGNHELQAWTQACHQTAAGARVVCTTYAEEGSVVSEVDLAVQTEQPAP